MSTLLEAIPTVQTPARDPLEPSYTAAQIECLAAAEGDMKAAYALGAYRLAYCDLYRELVRERARAGRLALRVESLEHQLAIADARLEALRDYEWVEPGRMTATKFADLVKFR